MTHTVDPQLLERPIRILVVGCGGNGSPIVSGLPDFRTSIKHSSPSDIPEAWL